jgi:Secretion system C-terminal sorting domain
MGDVDKDAVQIVQENFTSDSTKKLFYLPRTPLQEIKRVIVEADTLQFNQYCYDLENGWVMLASQPDSGANILVEASVSWDIDLGITNWDQNKGNYLFLNTSDPVFVNTEENLPDGFVLYQNYPNPFNPSTKIKFTIPSVGTSLMKFVQLKVYDVLGNEVATVVNEEKAAGKYEVEFNTNSVEGRNLTSGVYFYQLSIRGSEINSEQTIIQRKKMVYLK